MIIQFNSDSTNLTWEDLTSFPALRTTYRPFFHVLYKGSRIAFVHQHCLEKKVTYLWRNAVISYHFQYDHSSLLYLQLTVIIFFFLVLCVIPVETLDWENCLQRAFYPVPTSCLDISTCSFPSRLYRDLYHCYHKLQRELSRS